jgi:hydroxymethylpyrimidine pyrophosphatase-like HAD family hydrolase
MKIKLIVIDIDDTLLSSEGKILPSTKTVLQKALKQGGKNCSMFRSTVDRDAPIFG